MRAEPGAAAIDVAAQALLERRGRRRLRVVAELGLRQPELGGALGERGRQLIDRRAPPGDECGAG